MTSRSDIAKGKLVYTEHLGWIDLNHAQGKDAVMLWQQFESEIPTYEDDKNYFIVNYYQAMGMAKYGVFFKTGITSQFLIRKGLPRQKKISIALSIMLDISLKFEAHQQFPVFLTESGFSCEDLISNLVGFYKGVLNEFDYVSRARPYSKEYCYMLWDYYGDIGLFKVKDLRPMIFPNPEKFPNNAIPYQRSLPDFLNKIQPYICVPGEKDIIGLGYPSSSYGLKFKGHKIYGNEIFQ